MTATNLFSKIVFAIAALCASVGAAHAVTISGQFNSHGYQAVNLNVASAATVDFQSVFGYFDPMLMLFDAANHHLVTNDDSNGRFSHLTQNLNAGNYTLLVTFCCGGINAIPDSTFVVTDGVNVGTYWFGGTATLPGVEAYLDAYVGAEFIVPAGAQFGVDVTNATLVNDVPEPQSLALFGLALGALAMTRRRQFGRR